jgi:hypothetical protein
MTIPRDYLCNSGKNQQQNPENIRTVYIISDKEKQKQCPSYPILSYMILPNPPHHGPHHHHSHDSQSGIAYGGSIEAVPVATPAVATPKKSSRMQDESPP